MCIVYWLRPFSHGIHNRMPDYSCKGVRPIEKEVGTGLSEQAPTSCSYLFFCMAELVVHILPRIVQILPVMFIFCDFFVNVLLTDRGDKTPV